MTDDLCALVLDGDLFFVARIGATLRHVGYVTRSCRDAASFSRLLAELAPAVAFVNLAAQGVDWHAAISVARAAGVPVIAYGPHVDVALHEAARQAGADRVIANSKLAADLSSIVARTVRLGAATRDDGHAMPSIDARETSTQPAPAPTSALPEDHSRREPSS
jgi:CheY-like chemotaxis protein